MEEKGLSHEKYKTIGISRGIIKIKLMCRLCEPFMHYLSFSPKTSIFYNTLLENHQDANPMVAEKASRSNLIPKFGSQWPSVNR